MSVTRTSSRCWMVQRRDDGSTSAGLSSLPWDPAAPSAPDEAVVAVEAAGFNYKDALACIGHAGVMRCSPLIPGIDVAGTLEKAAGGLPAGAEVIVTANGIGEHRHGGFATQVRLPAAAVLRRPSGLGARDAMAMGTAGLTALMAVDRLAGLVHGRAAAVDAEWLVTGASGGVGMLAVACLAAAGRRVVAATRKPGVSAVLASLGAETVTSPGELAAVASKTLVAGRWGGVVDTVGGSTLAEVLKAVRPGGAVAAIGMAGGVEVPTSVHPFILRGVTLVGIDAAGTPTQAERLALWIRLADAWALVRDRLPVEHLALGDVGRHAARMLAGESIGRGVVVT